MKLRIMKTWDLNLSSGQTTTEVKTDEANAADLFWQLFFTELVEDVKFLWKNNVLQEPVAGQLDPHNDLSVRHHHSNRAELNFEIFRQLLPPCVARVLPQHISSIIENIVFWYRPKRPSKYVAGSLSKLHLTAKLCISAKRCIMRLGYGLTNHTIKTLHEIRWVG